MKTLAIVASLLFSTLLFAEDTAKAAPKPCKKNYERISCEEVEGAKRDSFCWKGKITEKKTKKVCLKAPKKKYVKKQSKKTKKTSM